MQTADQLLPEVLKLPLIERERLISEIEASMPEGHVFVSDEEVEQRLKESHEDPEQFSLSSDDFIQAVEKARDARRGS